ncbi:MAG: maleylpyruvate isomerase N-terminal domain-containing protein [Chloroflexota bacterium]
MEMMPPSLDFPAALVTHTGLLVDTAAALPFDAPVESCPGWSVVKLMRHLGTIQRWAQALVEAQRPERIDPRTLNLDLPSDDAGYASWLVQGAAALASMLRAANPNAPAWAWGADQHVRFWARRVAHESAVHAADVALAANQAPAIQAELAVDGISEFLENLPSRATFAPAVKELRGAGESLHLHCTDTEGEWLIRLEADGVHWEPGHAKATTAVRAAAADLELLLYRRLPPTDARFQSFGDPALLDRWLSLTSF